MTTTTKIKQGQHHDAKLTEANQHTLALHEGASHGIGVVFKLKGKRWAPFVHLQEGQSPQEVAARLRCFADHISQGPESLCPHLRDEWR